MTEKVVEDGVEEMTRPSDDPWMVRPTYFEWNPSNQDTIRA